MQDERAIRGKHVRRGALTIIARLRFLKRIAFPDGAIFRFAPAWAPPAARDVEPKGDVERRPINPGLPPGNDTFDDS